jgi:hypothetical protein
MDNEEKIKEIGRKNVPMTTKKYPDYFYYFPKR